MIDEKKLMVAIYDKSCSGQYNNLTINELVRDIIETIEQQPKIYKWVGFDCKPDIDQEILVRDDTGDIWVDRFLEADGEYYLDYNGNNFEGITWQPLPE